MVEATDAVEAACRHVLAALDRGPSPDDQDTADFRRRLDAHLPDLARLFHGLYGTRTDWLDQLAALVNQAAQSWAVRPAELKALDAAREDNSGWFLSNQMLGGVCYVDRYAGDLEGVRAQIPYFKELGLNYLHLMPLFLAPEPHSDGGYAVSSYREVNPKRGTKEQLRTLAGELRANGISLVLDLIFNHTSDEHEWACKASAGDPGYSDYYWIYPDRTMPDAFETEVREIFPDDHPGSFVPMLDGRWVWATFHTFQWDLNYSNPEVFRAMAGEMLFLANQGVDILRMDAVAFIWKQLGTPCENLPEAHLLLRAFNAVCRLSAPSLLFKSEAIVHPDEVAQYIDPAEYQLSYNPLQMALTWEAMATRDVSLLAQALEHRHNIPEGTSRVNYVRSHDDIGWTFADEDAAGLGINGFDHRRFLNASTPPIPGQFRPWRPVPGQSPDGRLPHFPADRYARRGDPSSSEGAVFAGLRTMISVRSRTPEMAGTKLLDFATGIPGVLGYQRPCDGTRILALANFSDPARKVPALTLSGFAARAVNVLTGNLMGLEQGIGSSPGSSSGSG